MNFLFSREANKNFLDFLDLILFCVLTSVVLTFLRSYHWFFNLFDQLWSFHLIVSVFLVFLFVCLRKKIQVAFSMLVFIISSFVFYHVKWNSPKVIDTGFKIYYHNINSSNSSIEELSKNIRNSRAEIVALVEVTPENEQVLLHKHSEYPVKYSLARDDNFGFLILGKINFNLEEVHESYEIPVYIKLFVEKHNVKIYLLHLPPPLWRDAWEMQKEALSLIASEINKNKNQSYLIFGDLNMTSSSSTFVDFYRQLGPSFYFQELFFQGTWPSFLPTFLRLPIDHVLSNRNFEINIGHAAGSDHKSIVIDIDEISHLSQEMAQ